MILRMGQKGLLTRHSWFLKEVRRSLAIASILSSTLFHVAKGEIKPGTWRS